MHGKSDALAEKMAKQLRLRGEGLKDVAARAGRKLPKRLRTEVEAIVDAQQMAENPKLMHHVDPDRIKLAERKLNRFLDRQNPAVERRAEMLDALAIIAFVIFTAVLAVFLLLLWRGYFD